MEINQNDLSSAMCDMYDIRKALSDRIKAKPKDNEGTEYTIGECIEDVIYFLEGLYNETNSEGSEA
jgi:hypothetical protein